MKKFIQHLTFSVAIGASMLLVAPSSAKTTDDDAYLWLEEIDGETSMQWVTAANQRTAESLASDPLYAEIYQDALAALNSQDKLPEIEVIGDWVYQLKKSAEHPRGIYLRSKIKPFNRGKPEWQTVVDIDAMSAADNIKWVFHGMDCLAPRYQKCLMFLSPGGGDADVMREFDAKTLRFVEGGFSLPQAKMNVTWMDVDHLFVATDFGANSLTESGYARRVKIWKRGQPLTTAEQILEVPTKSVWAVAQRLKSGSQHVDLLQEGIDYWNRNYWQRMDGKTEALALPSSAVIIDLIGTDLVVSLQEDWVTGNDHFTQGSVLLIDPQSLWPSAKKVSARVLRSSTAKSIIEDVTVNNNDVLITVLEDVKSRIYRYEKIEGAWFSEAVDLPRNGQLLVTDTTDGGAFYVNYEGFLTPPTLFVVDTALNARVVAQQPATFNAKDMQVQQHFAKSADGTQVPYFVVMRKDLELDGTNPTHIFSYGGFRVSLTPSYSGSYEPHNGAYGKAWLERGGVFVLANIRGGAEYGPAWHAAALLENRHKAFEDFEAVAEDLIARKITAPKHLGIEGRSNGGLLVGATMVRRSDLYGAVICGVPLLDMQRYNKLLAGASWMAEYGNPDTDDWDFMQTYSPYQNVKEDAEYPPIFFFTSTRDDRVHPGHARKMAAKMHALGHAVEYYENTEGGHKGSATAEQTARRIALSFTHLWRHLK